LPSAGPKRRTRTRASPSRMDTIRGGQRGGLPVCRSAGARRCTRSSAGQGLREQGGRRSAAERVGAPRELTAIRGGPCPYLSAWIEHASSTSRMGTIADVHEGRRIGIKRPGARLWAGGWALARLVRVLSSCCRRRGPQKERGGTGPSATRWGRNQGLETGTSLRRTRHLSFFRGSPFRGSPFRGSPFRGGVLFLGALSHAFSSGEEPVPEKKRVTPESRPPRRRSGCRPLVPWRPEASHRA
jgi:hypothetical protein